MIDLIRIRIYRAFQLFRDALNLDIYDLNYAYTPENMKYVLLSHVGVPRRGVVIRIGSFLWHLVKSIRELWPFSKTIFFERKVVLFFATTENQKNALSPLIDRVNDACLVGIRGYGTKRLPLLAAYLLSFFFFPLVLFRFLRSQNVIFSCAEYIRISFCVSICIRYIT